MKMKKLAFSCGALLLGASSLAQAGLSANIGVTSNYLWRGITQTGDGAAVSGGIDWGHDSGFYLGTWASNIDWGVGNGAEVDFYGGYDGSIGDFGYGIGAIYYYYPSSNYDDSDFAELNFKGSWKFLEAGIDWTIYGQADSGAPFDSGDLYYHLSVSFDVAETWSIGGTVGYYDFDTNSSWEDDNNHGDDANYSHIQLDIGKSAGDWGDFTFTVSKASTNYKSSAGDNNYWGNDTDDVKFLISWAKTFE